MRKPLVLLALAAGIFAAGANAAGPERTTQVVTIPGPSIYTSCANFDIVLTNLTIERFFITYADAAGNPVLERRHVHFEGTLTNSVTGASVIYTGHFMRTEDFVQHTITLTGMPRQAHTANGTIVAAGTTFFDDDVDPDHPLRVTGQAINGFDAQLCEALA
jgi:hypothetical protein